MTRITGRVERTGWIRGQREVNQTVERLERNVTRVVGSRLATAVMDATPRRSGESAKSVKYDPERQAVVAGYGVFIMEHGQRPGRRLPPVRAIAQWLGGRRGNPYLISRAIGRRGIRARPFVEKAVDRALRSPDFDSDVRAAVRDALDDAS